MGIEFFEYRSDVLWYTSESGKSVNVYCNNEETLKKFIFVSIVEDRGRHGKANRNDLLQSIHDSIFRNNYSFYSDKIVVSPGDVYGNKIDKINEDDIYCEITERLFNNIGNRNDQYNEYVKKYNIKSFQYCSKSQMYYEAVGDCGWFFSNDEYLLKNFLFANEMWNCETTGDKDDYDAQYIHDRIFNTDKDVNEISTPQTASKVDGVYFYNHAKGFRRCDDKTSQYYGFIKEYNIKIR